MPSTMIMVQMQIGLKSEVIMAVLDLDMHVAQNASFILSGLFYCVALKKL